MFYAIEKKDELENLEELASLKNRVEEVQIQDEVSKLNFHENVKKDFEPFTDTIKSTSENLTNTIRETSIENKKAIENLNEKVLELMNDKRMIALI